MNKHTDNDGNHSYNQELTDCIGLVAEASRVLEECKNYKISEINAISENENAATLFSTLFYNIGGNKSNFDNFAADIKALRHNFSVIGLAETNTNPNHGNLYPLDGYKPFYNPCMKDKSIGTGVALYIKQSFNPTILDHLCYCTENIETFFMKIHIDDVDTCVRVVYRSPNSNHSEFLEIYKTIMAQLKSNKNIHILGDFNTNLFKHNDPNTKNFEDHFLIECLYPTVSLQTHKRGHTTGSCIDNIFISDVQHVICSGVIPGIGKHHSPWITEGIIISITYKETLYNTWKRTRTKRLPDGDHDAHTKYSEYRKNLKHVITLAKESFSQKKILDNVNNHKKTWAAINQLRGKNKESMRPSFIINNERIIIERRIIADEFIVLFLLRQI